MNIKYPIMIKASEKFITELYYCEYERCMELPYREDAQNECVVCDLLDRHNTQIEIRNDAELLELYYATASGVIDLFEYTTLIGIAATRFRLSANRLLDKIRPLVETIDPILVKRWPRRQTNNSSKSSTVK